MNANHSKDAETPSARRSVQIKRLLDVMRGAEHGGIGQVRWLLGSGLRLSQQT